MNEKVIFSSNRKFEVWRYTVSHHQLLIRSNKHNSSSTRIEVLFKDVVFMAIPPVMNGLTITKCDAIDDVPLANLAGLHSLKPWYRIDADRLVGYVAAGAFITNEDELGYEDASPLMPVAL
jgi:hypothetical protein